MPMGEPYKYEFPSFPEAETLESAQSELIAKQKGLLAICDARIANYEALVAAYEQSKQELEAAVLEYRGAIDTAVLRWYGRTYSPAAIDSAMAALKDISDNPNPAETLLARVRAAEWLYQFLSTNTEAQETCVLCAKTYGYHHAKCPLGEFMEAYKATQGQSTEETK